MLYVLNILVGVVLILVSIITLADYLAARHKAQVMTRVKGKYVGVMIPNVVWFVWLAMIVYAILNYIY